MKLKNPCFGLIISFFLLAAGVSTAQSGNEADYLRIAAGVPTDQSGNQADYLRRIQNGYQLYDISRWYEAAMEFRRAQEIAGNINDWSHALYWVILSELAYTDYGSALRDMDELQRTAPGSTYNRDMLYHRARVYYNQGFFDEALLLFMNYTGAVTDINRESSDRKAAAFFWMGECLYSMGQFDEAENFYSFVIARYPESLKVEAASYRIDLIKQKKIEAELLALLQWSHEEALRTSEDYQRKIRTYEYTLNTYQRRITELTQGNVQAYPGEQAPVTPYATVPPVVAPAGQPADTPSAGNIPVQSNPPRQAPDESLLERARQLGLDLQKVLDEFNDSRGAM